DGWLRPSYSGFAGNVKLSNHANASGFVSNNGVFVQKGGSVIIGGNGSLSNNIYSNGTHGIVVFEGADYVQMFTNSIYCNGAKGINIGCAGGFAGKTAGNGSFGCGTLTLNAFTANPSIVSGGRPASSLVYVYGTNLCQSSTCGANPQGQLLFTASISSYPTGTTWTYNNGAPMFGDITALALGTGANCASSYCRTSEYSNCVDNVVLPIQLKYFQVKVIGNQLVELDWQSAGEKNNDYFEIEKSTDGNVFETLGRVKGSGNSSHDISYQFQDPGFNSQVAYYRIKQVDFNGTVRYTEVKMVQNRSQNQIAIYPNPNSGKFTVILSAKGEYQISIVDMLGKIVHQEFADLEFGLGKEVQTQLPTGAYVVQIKNEIETKTERIVIE
ncbi:MAG: T9SS type A sorting domain-containing protein, partial [Cytophagales bacterium]|nr:T9SS type A sorting domain-containing protein [Cytophagales bacterium]